MPTLTRLAALVSFAVMAFYLASKYQSLNEDIPEAQSINIFFAVVAAAVGWVFVGQRINRHVLQAFSVVIQGYIATFLLALGVSALYGIFTKGYQMRYKTFGDALEGSVNDAWAILQQISTADFATVGLGGAAAISLLLVVVYRMAEAKRVAR
jgi:uncharacterized membrane protein